MTDTLARPPQAPAEERPAGAPARRASPDDPGPALLPAEVALASATVAALLPYTKVFEGGGLFPSLVVAAVGSHLLSATLRRARAPFWLVLSTSVLAFVVVGTWVAFPQTTTVWLPTPETGRAVVDALSASLERADQDAVPVPADPGFVVVTFAATWLSAAVADRAAFRWWFVLQALVPASALFVVGAVLAPREASGRTAVGTAFLVTALLFVLLQRPLVASRRLRWSWSAGGRTGRARQTATGVLVLVAVAATAAMAVPRLPGGDGAGLVDWRPGDAAAPRTTDSPLIDIRSRLVDQGQEVLFTVEASQPAYWRTTSLDVFDGSIWRSDGRYRGADGELDQPDGEPVADEVVEQRFELEDPGQIWLPAAFRPQSVEAGDVGVRYDQQSSTLIVDSDRETSDGITYEVTSAPPPSDPVVLDAATAAPPPDVAARYLGLPDGFSPDVVALAAEVTADARTPYQQAQALEAFFLDGSFTYSLEVAPGHGSSAVEDFLERRSGYCEQFAGTYAAMARAVGLPSRVAVGYMAGELDPNDPRRHLVKGEDAHAWPEVWLTGVGWIPMEPTPPDPADAAEAPATTTTTAPPTTAAPSTVPGTQPPATAPEDDAASTSGSDPTAGGGVPRALVALAAAGLAVLLAAGLTAAIAARTRRLRGEGAAGRRVEATWGLVLDDLASLGHPPHRAQTPQEVAHALVAASLVPTADATALADVVGRARWAPDEVAAADADRAAAVGVAVEQQVTARLRPARRVLRAVDVRRLWRRPGRAAEGRR